MIYNQKRRNIFISTIYKNNLIKDHILKIKDRFVRYLTCCILMEKLHYTEKNYLSILLQKRMISPYIHRFPTSIYGVSTSSRFSGAMDRTVGLKASSACFNAALIRHVYSSFFDGFPFYGESLFFHEYGEILRTENHQTIIFLMILQTCIENRRDLFLQ